MSSLDENGGAATLAGPCPSPKVSLVPMPRGLHDLPLGDKYCVALTVEPTAFVRGMPISKRSYRVGRSFCCVRAPNTSASIDITGPSTSVLIVQIPSAWLENYLDGTGASLLVGGGFVEAVDPTVMLLGEKIWRRSVNLREPLLAESMNQAFVLHLLAHYGRGVRRPAGVPMKRMRTLLDYIENNLSEKLSLDGLAAIAGTSRFEFARSFARTTGIPPHRYVMTRRAKAAVDLIRSGQLPLSEIALAAGFCDQAHMSRCISREIGISPARLAGASFPDRP